MALIMQPEKMNAGNEEILRKISQSDSSPFVQIAACHALVRGVDEEQKLSSLRQLITVFESTDGWFVALSAIETLDQLDSSKWEWSEINRLKDAMKRAKSIAPPHGRYDSYIPRLVESLESKLNP